MSAQKLGLGFTRICRWVGRPFRGRSRTEPERLVPEAAAVDVCLSSAEAT